MKNPKQVLLLAGCAVLAVLATHVGGSTLPTFQRTRFSELDADRVIVAHAYGEAQSAYRHAFNAQEDTSATVATLQAMECELHAIDLARHFTKRYAETQADFLPTILEDAYNDHLDGKTTCDAFAQQLQAWIDNPPVELSREEFSGDPTEQP